MLGLLNFHPMNILYPSSSEKAIALSGYSSSFGVILSGYSSSFGVILSGYSSPQQRCAYEISSRQGAILRR
jgi:hypothetical protein